jgi:hypothetical protein
MVQLATDHGWPLASDGTDGHGLDAFKNERDYIAQSGHHKTTVAAMDWAIREIGSATDLESHDIEAIVEHVAAWPLSSETRTGPFDPPDLIDDWIRLARKIRTRDRRAAMTDVSKE